MQLDTETAKTIMAASEQCNAVAEEATRRVVELMQEAIEYRERIAELDAALRSILSIYESKQLEDAEAMDEIGKIVRNAIKI